MKKIILHIGQPKTGSSALQSYFYNNREKLESKKIGYYYPKYSYTPWFTYSNGSMILSEASIRLKEPQDKQKKQWLANHPSLDIFSIRLNLNIEEKTEQLKEDFSIFKEYARHYDTLIFSEELLWHNVYFYDNYFKIVKEIFDELIEEKTELDIVIYLRRQDKWILSKWKEDMRNEIASPLDFYETLKDYEEIGYLDYYYGLKQIEKNIDKKHIIVRSFDRNKFLQGNIINDFILSNKDIAYDDLLVEKSENVNVNIGVRTALALVSINKKKVDITDRDIRFYRASEIFNRYFDNDNNATIMSEKETKELLDRYISSNRLIEQEFLSGEELFSYETDKHKAIKPDTKRDNFNAYLLSIIAKYIVK